MDKELKFSKLSEVELVEEASENAHILIEENGKIKRLAGDTGGSGYPYFELTTIFNPNSSTAVVLNEVDTELLDKILSLKTPVTLKLPLPDDGYAICSCSYMNYTDMVGLLVSGGIIMGIIVPPGVYDDDYAIGIIMSVI